jgi:hypothetical protein
MAGVKLEKLTLETIGIVDPRIEGMFQKHVRQIVDDVMNRPAEPAARKLTLEFLVTPVIREDPDTGESQCDEVKVSFEGKSKVPTFRTRAFPMKVSRAGLQFNREIPEDLHQPSIFDDDPREA